ncbi:uncharacterized protein LOC130510509 isoform X2 [Raphanus sativus]|uniref:Uncharacterized protein LOC130510509 isoform X2 n=1 Tax=Raphanus sativus TaxID=3726 RepID=A0A9W3DG52_RAPSA|nr:uncharacterized protein LOC130510509 isoform X2 [Raphanus sativus]
MKPACVVDDAEFWLPPEFLTDDDFLVEKENKESVFPYETSHGFALDSSYGDDEESFLAGLSRKMSQSSLRDDFSGAKAWGMTRPTQSTRCGGGYGCQTRVSSSQSAAAWDIYCAAAEELAMMSLNGYNNRHSGRGLAAAKISNDGSGFYSRQSLQYQKLQAIQLKQLQLMKEHRRYLAQQSVDSRTKSTTPVHVDLSPSAAWPQRRGVSGMRAVSLGGDRTGTGVFLPRSVDRTSPVTAQTRNKPSLGTVLVPARVAHVLDRNESVVHQTPVRSSASFNDGSWRQRSNNGGYSSQMMIEQTVNEPRLPSDWAY